MTGVLFVTVTFAFALIGMKVTWDKYKKPIINIFMAVLRMSAYPIVWLTNGKQQAEVIRKEHSKWLAD